MSLEPLYKYPVATSRGSSINTESQLKKSCTVAPAKALRALIEETENHTFDIDRSLIFSLIWPLKGVYLKSIVISQTCVRNN